MITYWIKKDNDLALKHLEKEKMLDAINQAKQIFNDPLDTIKKAKEALTYLWQATTSKEDVRLDLEKWKELYAWFQIRPCTTRTTTKVEKTCCGGKKTIVLTYYCNKKNQPITSLGCSKCKEAQ